MSLPPTTSYACILFPILRLLTGSELMWNNVLVIWAAATAALPAAAGRQFLPATFPETFPMRQRRRATPVVVRHSFEGASTLEVLHSVKQFDGLFDSVWTQRSGNGRSILNYILGERAERERDNSSLAAETGEPPPPSWNFRELHN